MKPHQTFIFDSYSYTSETGTIELVYVLKGAMESASSGFEWPAADDEIRFVETLTLPLAFPPSRGDAPGMREALHALHLVGGISYYKTCLPKTIEIRTQPLSDDQAHFWDFIYENGLGEFFFRNQIDFRDLIHFPSMISPTINAQTTPIPKSFVISPKSFRILVPLGGGKDSVVTVELLRKAGYDITLLRVGSHPLITALAQRMELPLLEVKRQLDPQLFRLNAEGALNGHVPITAYLSFLALVIAELYDFDAVVWSNERSASFGNVPYHGKEINHQWSKGMTFEREFQRYTATYTQSSCASFSLLRPLSELYITKLFTQYPQYLSLTTSCNRNWKIVSSSPPPPTPLPRGERGSAPSQKSVLPSPTGGRVGDEGNKALWCGTCPKCAFVFALFAAFLPRETVMKTFGNDLFADASLLPLYKQLLGLEGFKPFECVGTPEEMKAALLLASQKKEWEGTPVTDLFQKDVLPDIEDPDALLSVAMTPSPDHCIPPSFLNKIPSLIPNAHTRPQR